jgi:hypothetical protein
MKRVRRQDFQKSPKNMKTYKKLGKSIPKEHSSKSKDKDGIKLNTKKIVN